MAKGLSVFVEKASIIEAHQVRIHADNGSLHFCSGCTEMHDKRLLTQGKVAEQPNKKRHHPTHQTYQCKMKLGTGWKSLVDLKDGDYIIKHPDGSYSVMAQEEFEAKYIAHSEPIEQEKFKRLWDENNRLEDAIKSYVLAVEDLLENEKRTLHKTVHLIRHGDRHKYHPGDCGKRV